MFSDDGGVGTVSSSVRRTRSSRGVFGLATTLLRGFAATRVAAVLREVGLAFFVTLPRFRAAGRLVRVALDVVFAPRFAAAFFVGRFAKRLTAGRFFVGFAAFARRVALRLAIAVVLSEP